jgi:SAM-dependent methyltransferase
MVGGLDECFFYHTMDLPEFGIVPGLWDLRGHFDDYVGRIDLQGKTVLDVGTASGFLAFEAEKRGASVVAFDLADASTQALLPFQDGLYYQNHKDWVAHQTRVYEPVKNSFWLAHRLYGSKAKMYYGSIYDLPEDLGKFDVVLLGSVIEHLSDPIQALASISKVTGDLIVINTTMLDTDEKVARFEGNANDRTHEYTWWILSRGLYREVFAMMGFGLQRISGGRYHCAMTGHWQPRDTLVFKRTDAKPWATAILAGDALNGPGMARSKDPKPWRQTLAGFLDELGTTRAQFVAVAAELEATRQQLTALENLGPLTLEVARKCRRLIERYPKTFSLVKPVVRSLTRRRA